MNMNMNMGNRILGRLPYLQPYQEQYEIPFFGKFQISDFCTAPGTQEITYLVQVSYKWVRDW